ncbi:hypothetical protein AVEN_212466-1, partial [Araneus ventricosus]
ESWGSRQTKGSSQIVVFRRCEEDLRLWFKGKKNSFSSGISMMCREEQNHTTDCYFCSVDVRSFNTKNRNDIFYSNLSSAIRSVPLTSEIRVPNQPSNLDDIQSDSEYGDTLPHQDEYNSDFSSDEGPQPFLRATIMI